MRFARNCENANNFAVKVVNLETGFDWFSNRVKVFIWVGIVFREVEKSSIIIMMYSAYLDVDGHKN